MNELGAKSEDLFVGRDDNEKDEFDHAPVTRSNPIALAAFMCSLNRSPGTEALEKCGHGHKCPSSLALTEQVKQ